MLSLNIAHEAIVRAVVAPLASRHDHKGGRRRWAIGGIDYQTREAAMASAETARMPDGAWEQALCQVPKASFKDGFC